MKRKLPVYYMPVYKRPTLRDNVWTREDLAKELNRSPEDLDLWDAQGVGPPRIVIGKTDLLVLYLRESLNEWLLKRERERSPKSSKKAPRIKPTTAAKMESVLSRGGVT